jgi:hypothetical protein
MKKNKFNIGQVVIVLDNSKATEKIVETITEKDGVLVYSLKGLLKKRRYDFKKTYGISDGLHHEMMSATIWQKRFMPSAMIVDDVDVKKSKFVENYKDYKESEIFENEADFRANIKIQTLPKEKSKKKAA